MLFVFRLLDSVFHRWPVHPHQIRRKELAHSLLKGREVPYDIVRLVQLALALLKSCSLRLRQYSEFAVYFQAPVTWDHLKKDRVSVSCVFQTLLQNDYHQIVVDSSHHQRLCLLGFNPLTQKSRKSCGVVSYIRWICTTMFYDCNGLLLSQNWDAFDLTALLEMWMTNAVLLPDVKSVMTVVMWSRPCTFTVTIAQANNMQTGSWPVHTSGTCWVLLCAMYTVSGCSCWNSLPSPRSLSLHLLLSS